VNTRLRGLRDRALEAARQSVGRYPIVKAAVPVLVLTLIATLVMRPTSGPGPDPSQPVAHASGGPGSSSPSGPTSSPEPWEDLALDPAVLVATLTPDGATRAGVAAAGRFTLKSLNGTAARTLAAGIQTEPSIELKITDGATADEVVLQPKEPLAEGQTYRIRLRTPDGSLGGSWAFRTQRAPRVVGTLPGDLRTEVPLDTGIEITFDQDGTTGVDSRFHIEPATPGRVEQHERTWAFVPDKPLSPATLYTVTLDPGVGLQGSDLTLRTRTRFQFETASKATASEVVVRFTGPMAAIRPSEQPSLPIYRGSDAEGGGGASTSKLLVEIYGLPSLARTLDAVGRLTGPASWTLHSDAARVSTDGLVRVARLEAPVVVDLQGATMLTIPIRLDPGAYLVVIPRGESAQLVLQVSNLGVYALSTETDTVAWLNDLATVKAVAGATVTSVDGRRFAVTDATGLARFQTPSELQPQVREPLFTGGEYWESRPAPRLIAVTAPDGRWLVAGLGSAVSTLDGPYDNEISRASEPGARWWLLLSTDRGQYRQTDTIHAWGVVRSRDDGTLPTNVRLALYAVDEDSGEPNMAAAIVTARVALNRSGAFAADIPIASLPRSSYRLHLEVGGAQAESQWIEVADIRKPSYRIDVTTDRYAYRHGEPIEVAVKASFFDGTAVPGIDLHVTTGDEDTVTAVTTTDRSGAAHLTVRANFEGNHPYGWNSQRISVSPVGPEEGEITGGADVIVFPSAAWLTGTAGLSGTTLRIDGKLSRVAFGAIDDAYASGSWDWSDVITGRPIAEREVVATVVRHRQVRRDLGTRYDYLEKRVVHAYEYDTVRETLGTYRTRTAGLGTYHLSVTVPSSKDGYEITMRSSDPAGRPVVTDAYASPTVNPVDSARPSFLIADNGCGFASTVQLGLNATFDVTMHDGDGRVASTGRFLFLVGNRGLRQATVSDTPSYSRALRERDLPGFMIRGVQVTSEGYTTADASASIDVDDMNVQVRLEPDRARYQPGDHVSVAVTTLGPDGRPVAADVVIHGVDEKLFEIGAAQQADVLRSLYRWVGPGFLQSFASHRIPLRPNEGGCGAGGGGRESFGDVVTAQLVRTGRDGRATVSFDLLDDLTSWRLSAMAVTDALRAGQGSVLIPVSLPFFVESVLAPDYLVGEAPVLRVRAYGDALRAGDLVRFTVSAPSLGLAETTVEGRAFQAVRVPLPPLTMGEHRIRVQGRGPDAGMRDAVIRSVHVIETRLSSLTTTYDRLAAGYLPQGGEGLTTYAITDAGRGSLLSTLVSLSSTMSARFDRLAAAEVARRILIDEFGFEANETRDPGLESGRYQRSGIALLPYASEDPELSALIALVAPGQASTSALRDYLRNLMGEEQSRETRIMALAGRAGLGDDVLESLLAFDSTGLTIRESLWLALGFAAVGDENTARSIERALLEQHGERYGPWVRLAVGANTEDTLNAGRLLLILSARLGEPIARDVLRYLDDHSSNERATDLERLAYVEAGLERLPRAAGRFAWTVAGERHEVELRPGGTSTLVLTAPQRATLTLERLEGELAVVTSWSGQAVSLPGGGGVAITRTVTPADDAPDDRLVKVVITVDLGSVPYDGCWQIRDTAPSGLAPIERSWEWPDEDEGISRLGSPYAIDGQSVLWCMSRSDPYRSVTYMARVVSPGTYSWQPAVMQAVDAPELGAATPAQSFTIR
jgi:alpha-2-macroglobulin